MPRLVVKHKAAGYEGWKRETKFHGPNWRVIFLFVFGLFTCGFVSAASAGVLLTERSKANRPVPTLAVVVAQATPTPTQGYSVQVRQQPTPDTTPDLQATLNAMVAARPTEPSISAPIFCDGAVFESYTVGETVRVTFSENGALRLLDRARVPNEPEPSAKRLLYDGWRLRVEGEPVCGRWSGQPVAYYPVYSFGWREFGFVGLGANGDVWLVRDES